MTTATAPPATLPEITPADALPAGPRNVHARMLAIVAGIGWVPKTGHNDFHNYDFATATDIKDRVRDLLVENGVMLHTTIDDAATEIHQGAKASILATVRGTFSFVNVDDPVDRVVVAWAGQALDTSDKAMAKAMTSGIKYGLLNAFSIPTGADPDADSGQIPEQRRTAPRTTQRPAPAQDRPESSRPAAAPASSGVDADGVPWPDEQAAPPARTSRPAPGARPEERASMIGGACPKHDKQWRAGKYGWFCSSKDDSTESGYCTLRPSKDWVSAHER